CARRVVFTAVGRFDVW
nr:immunoglobulin heavy chain junction region [Macaca mulatta]MOY23619.1 immunoglobulin heavy chain junction region [Macaca mulatta]MOY23841.1 immunoglobulin heavy chain junction region [Macaca mulatta]MOY24308.1 immunoglobulin heavy chain junction region [Macaca mulatta]MOY25575.1 immunoglobulin heavy chain junction region [Macaca mulatta]